MGHEVQYLSETRRLASLVAVVFAVFMMFQYFEFPFGDVVSSLFSASRAQEVVNGTNPPEALPQIPQIHGNITHSYALNTSDNVSNSSVDALSTIPATHSPLSSPAPLTPPITVDTTLTGPSIVLDPTQSNRDQKDVSKSTQILKNTEKPKPRWSSTVDQELLNAKRQIENAPIIRNDPALYPSLYLNISRFKKSYELMEKTLKVYIYKEGEKPIFHQPTAVLKGIYASEGWFMKHMKASKHIVTIKPEQAHLFYIPFSSRMLEVKLYVPESHSRKNLNQYLKNYLDLIVGKYTFWNRTDGSDHFIVACHDWAPSETREYMDTCIRAMCNSDVKREGFKLGKDVSLPETTVSNAKNPLREVGGKPATQRSILAFFAGRMHGNLRPILLQHWENKSLT
ncbi:probable glycosyltransferase [Tanacetum coccineum]